MILPALTEATSPFWRPIKYSLFPPLGLATLAGYLGDDDVETELIRAGGALFTTLDLIVVAVTVASMVLLHALLQWTHAGTALRALASNFDLAVTRGVPGEHMIRLMWFLSGAYAALGGTLLAIATQLTPNMDLMILLPVFALVTFVFCRPA